MQPLKPVTFGHQRYLPTNKAGAGAINLVALSKSLKMSFMQKLLSPTNPIGRLAKSIFTLLGIKPSDVLWASKWEIKTISFYLNEAGLSYWANLLTLYMDIRNLFYDATSTEPQFRSPLTENRPWSKLAKLASLKLKLPLDSKYWTDKITIFNSKMTNFISIFPLKSQLLDSSGSLLDHAAITRIAAVFNINSDNVPSHHIIKKHLGHFLSTYNSMLTKPKHGCLLGEALYSRSIRSLNKNTYFAIIRPKALKDFSASKKWMGAGFAYSPSALMQAAQRISNSKASGIYKSTVLKYLLRGFTEPYMLFKLGYRNQECYFCQEKGIHNDFEHLFLFCPAAVFIKAHLDEIVYRHSKVRIDWDPSQLNLMTNKGSKKQRSIAIAAKITYVGILHLEFHKKIKLYYTSESLLIDIVNRIISSLKLTHPSLSDLNPIKRRLKFSKASKTFFKPFSRLRLESSSSPVNNHIRPGSEAFHIVEDQLILSILSTPPSLESEISQVFSFF